MPRGESSVARLLYSRFCGWGLFLPQLTQTRSSLSHCHFAPRGGRVCMLSLLKVSQQSKLAAMKGLRNVTVAQKKPEAQMLKKRKAEEQRASKKKANKKDFGAPKRPPTAYLLFMEEFRKTYKENFPDNKSVAVVAKAGGEKWNSMSISERAPYTEKASKKKADYEEALEAYKKNGSFISGDAETAQSSKSSSEVHDDGEQEASS